MSGDYRKKGAIQTVFPYFDLRNVLRSVVAELTLIVPAISISLARAIDRLICMISTCTPDQTISYNPISVKYDVPLKYLIFSFI